MVLYKYTVIKLIEYLPTKFNSPTESKVIYRLRIEYFEGQVKIQYYHKSPTGRTDKYFLANDIIDLSEFKSYLIELIMNLHKYEIIKIIL